MNPEFKSENVPIFKEILEILKRYPPCPGCNGREDCTINQCAKNKNIDNCSKCELLNIDLKSCTEELKPSDNAFMIQAPVFFNKLVKRYRNWNIDNLNAIKQGMKEEFNKKIDKMIKEGKTNRDVIDLLVNIFDSGE